MSIRSTGFFVVDAGTVLAFSTGSLAINGPAFSVLTANEIVFTTQALTLTPQSFSLVYTVNMAEGSMSLQGDDFSVVFYPTHIRSMFFNF